MQKLVIREYVDEGCAVCGPALERALVRAPGVRGRVLRLAKNERLIMSPDYNSAGVLTHFHVEVVDRMDIAGV